MCKISNDIKLCSCNSEVDSLDNMWILKSNSAPKSYMIGDIAAPTYEGKELKYSNLELLLDKLNSKNLFDFDYAPKNNDQLEIQICLNKEKAEYLNYTFYFKLGRWTDQHPFEDLKLKKIKNKGTIENAIK